MNISTSVSVPSECHDFQNGSFDHLADERDDFEEMLNAMCEDDGDAGPFPATIATRQQLVTYAIGSIMRQRSVTVISSASRK